MNKEWLQQVDPISCIALCISVFYFITIIYWYIQDKIDSKPKKYRVIIGKDVTRTGSFITSTKFPII